MDCIILAKAVEYIQKIKKNVDKMDENMNNYKKGI